jgi:hypothetical protein
MPDNSPRVPRVMREDLPSWRDTPAKQLIVEFAAAVTVRDGAMSTSTQQGSFVDPGE